MKLKCPKCGSTDNTKKRLKVGVKESELLTSLGNDPFIQLTAVHKGKQHQCQSCQHVFWPPKPWSSSSKLLLWLSAILVSPVVVGLFASALGYGDKIRALMDYTWLHNYVLANVEVIFWVLTLQVLLFLIFCGFFILVSNKLRRKDLAKLEERLPAEEPVEIEKTEESEADSESAEEVSDEDE